MEVLIIVLVVLTWWVFYSIYKIKQLKSVVCEKEFFYETILDHLPNPITYKNLDGKYVYCNNEFAKMVGKEKDEVIGGHTRTVFKDLVDENTINCFIGSDIRLLRDKKSLEKYIKDMPTKDGKTIKTLFNKICVYNTNHEMTGMLSVATDISKLDYMNIKDVLDIDENNVALKDTE